jgi:hypothetical protein
MTVWVIQLASWPDADAVAVAMTGQSHRHKGDEGVVLCLEGIESAPSGELPIYGKVKVL